MKAVIYARQSSGSNDFSPSVENQIRNCRELAEKMDLEITGCYSDLNTSGKTYPAGAENIADSDDAFQNWYLTQTGKNKFRTGLGEVFRHLEEIDYIIVDEMTRLYRPLTRSFLEPYVNQRLVANHVRILQCKGGTVNLNEFDQQLIQTLKNQIQDEAIANQKRKAKEQIRKMRDEGLLCNGAKMLGVEYLGKQKVRFVPGMSELVVFVYDSILKGESYNHIVRSVNIRFKDVLNGCFYGTTLRSIARQPVYCGCQYNSCGELIENKYLKGKGIIPQEKWLEVQKIMNTPRRGSIQERNRHWLPFSGYLFCGCCQRHLLCQIDRGNLFYQCPCRNLLDRKECGESRIRIYGTKKGNGLWDAVYPLLCMGLTPESDWKRMTALIRKKILDHADFEELLKKSIRKIDVFSDKIECTLFHGKIILPRLWKETAATKYMPEWKLICRKKDHTVEVRYFSGGYATIEDPGTKIIFSVKSFE